MHYMLVTGYRQCYLAVVIGGQQFRWYGIPWNERIAETVKNRCLRFWQLHVIGRHAPQPVTASDVAAFYASGGGAPVVASTDVVEALEELAAIKALNKRQKELELIIKKHMKEADTLLHPETGKELATWKGSVSNRFDSATFKDAHPALYQEFTKQQHTRRFLVKVKGNTEE
jgi:predicted phage-related endonuclease